MDIALYDTTSDSVISVTDSMRRLYRYSFREQSVSSIDTARNGFFQIWDGRDDVFVAANVGTSECSSGGHGIDVSARVGLYERAGDGVPRASFLADRKEGDVPDPEAWVRSPRWIAYYDPYILEVDTTHGRYRWHDLAWFRRPLYDTMFVGVSDILETPKRNAAIVVLSRSQHSVLHDCKSGTGLSLPFSGPAISIRDGKRVWMCDGSGVVELDTETLRVRRRLRLESTVDWMSLSHSGDYVCALTGRLETVLRIDVKMMEVTHRVHFNDIVDVVGISHGEYALRHFDSEAQEEWREYRVPTTPVWSKHKW